MPIKQPFQHCLCWRHGQVTLGALTVSIRTVATYTTFRAYAIQYNVDLLYSINTLGPKHPRRHTHKHTHCTHAHTHTLEHTHTHLNTHTHTHTYTHTHTHIHTQYVRAKVECLSVSAGTGIWDFFSLTVCKIWIDLD